VAIVTTSPHLQVLFSKEQQALWHAAEEKEFGAADDPALLKWARHGGKY